MPWPARLTTVCPEFCPCYAKIEGDIQAKLAGLPGRLVDLGGTGKGSISREDFEGLTREATAIALKGDRECRERVFNKMFDRLSGSSSQLAPSFRSPHMTPDPFSIGGLGLGTEVTEAKAKLKESDFTRLSSGVLSAFGNFLTE